MKPVLVAIAAMILACSRAPGSAEHTASPVEETKPLDSSTSTPPPGADSGGEMLASPADASSSTAGVCGTRGGVQCTADEFCDYGGDELCGATDKGGHCKPITKACTRIYMPVCGCNSRTYGNECEAHARGVSVKHSAMCTPEECQGAGGTVKYSNGADMPKCGAAQDQWSLSGGKEAVICCVDKE